MLHLGPLFATLATTPASPATEVEAPRPPRVLETTLSAGGGIAGGAEVSGVTFSALVTHDIGMLELGIEGATTLLVSRMYGAGLLAGLRVGDDVSFRVLGTGGVHHYDLTDVDALDDPPDVGGTLPYVGVRWLFGYRFQVSNPERRPWLGVLGVLDYDLLPEDKTVTYTDYFGGPERTSTYQLGQLTYAALFMLGWELDLTPY